MTVYQVNISTDKIGDIDYNIINTSLLFLFLTWYYYIYHVKHWSTFREITS